MYRTFIVCLYMYCDWRSKYLERRIGFSLSGITPPHIYVCSKREPGFQRPMVCSFIMFIELSWEMIVHFVNIVGIIGYALALEIQLSKRESWCSVYWFNTEICMCLFQARTDLDFQRHASWSFYIEWVEVRGDCSFCWYWWNCWS